MPGVSVYCLLSERYKLRDIVIINYGAAICCTRVSTTSFHKLQIAQHESQRVSIGSHLMSSIDHLHAEAEMRQLKDYSELLFAQYMVNVFKCLQPTIVCHHITTRGPPPRRYTRH